MIKRLRTKIICVIMAITILLLSLIMVMICQVAWLQMKTSSLAMLQSALQEPLYPSELPNKGPQMIQPYFILRMDRDGHLDVVGNDHYDLSDENVLRQIYIQARRDGKNQGILYQWDLRYCQLGYAPNASYAFLDISEMLDSVRILIHSCIIIGLFAIMLFFVISLVLVRWLVRPVEMAFDAQRQFVCDASHELKTPLTVILTNAELLQAPEYAPEDKARFATAIQNMSYQMRGLVESLLQLARVDRHYTETQSAILDLSTLTEACVLPFEPVYFESGLMLESQIQPNLRVVGNGAQLQQVIEILLDNGRKYATAGTTVTLQLSQQNYGHHLLAVTSQGQTLTPQQCQDIFLRFYRVDEARSRDGSYGLGLSIASGIVKRHRGKIWCQSKDGENTFYVRLPAPNRKTDRPSQENTAKNQKKV